MIQISSYFSRFYYFLSIRTFTFLLLRFKPCNFVSSLLASTAFISVPHMPEQNAIYIYNDSTLQVEPYVRDPRITWPDSSGVGFDGCIRFNINLLPYQLDWNNGPHLRQYPGVILRSNLLNNGTKSVVLAAWKCVLLGWQYSNHEVETSFGLEKGTLYIYMLQDCQS